MTVEKNKVPFEDYLTMVSFHDTITTILASIKNHVGDNIVFQGGNSFLKEENGQIQYNTTFLSFLSFCVACKGYKNALEKGNKAGIALIVDDLYLSPESRSLLKEAFQLPEPLQIVVDYYDIQTEVLLVVYESTLRNRGCNAIKKHKKTGKVMRKEGGYVTSKDHYQYADTITNAVGAPLCRLIMAEFLKDVEKHGFTQCINVHDTVMIKCMGRFVVIYQTLLGGTMEVLNIYVSGKEEEITVEIDAYKEGEEKHISTDIVTILP